MNAKIEQIQRLLIAFEMDYHPEENEMKNFRYAYQLCVAFASFLAQLDDKNFYELGNTSQSTYMRMAREHAGIDHDEFLLHIRDGHYAEIAEDILNES